MDPASAWFGVPHREFVVLDDLQAIAHQMLGFVGAETPDICDRLRAGVKLHPDLPWAQLNLARGLVSGEHHVEAVEAVRTAERLQPGRWDVAIVRGFLDESIPAVAPWINFMQRKCCPSTSPIS